MNSAKSRIAGGCLSLFCRESQGSRTLKRYGRRRKEKLRSQLTLAGLFEWESSVMSNNGLKSDANAPRSKGVAKSYCTRVSPSLWIHFQVFKRVPRFPIPSCPIHCSIKGSSETETAKWSCGEQYSQLKQFTEMEACLVGKALDWYSGGLHSIPSFPA